MADTKQCARCQEVKPVTAFYKHKKWDGFHPYCRACFNAYGMARREKKLAAHPELVAYRWKRDLVRHDYFHQIDSPIKAYILGFLTADRSTYSWPLGEISLIQSFSYSCRRAQSLHRRPVVTRHRVRAGS